MEKEKIARINALAHKAKTSGLTEAELAERDALRQCRQHVGTGDGEILRLFLQLGYGGTDGGTV